MTSDNWHVKYFNLVIFYNLAIIYTLIRIYILIFKITLICYNHSQNFHFKCSLGKFPAGLDRNEYLATATTNPDIYDLDLFEIPIGNTLHLYQTLLCFCFSFQICLTMLSCEFSIILCYYWVSTGVQHNHDIWEINNLIQKTYHILWLCCWCFFPDTEY